MSYLNELTEEELPPTFKENLKWKTNTLKVNRDQVYYPGYVYPANLVPFIGNDECYCSLVSCMTMFAGALSECLKVPTPDEPEIVGWFRNYHQGCYRTVNDVILSGIDYISPHVRDIYSITSQFMEHMGVCRYKLGHAITSNTRAVIVRCENHVSCLYYTQGVWVWYENDKRIELNVAPGSISVSEMVGSNKWPCGGKYWVCLTLDKTK